MSHKFDCLELEVVTILCSLASLTLEMLFNLQELLYAIWGQIVPTKHPTPIFKIDTLKFLADFF